MFPFVSLFSLFSLKGSVPFVFPLFMGLLPFIGREIEFEPLAWAPGEVAQRVLGLCQYLILHGPVIGDGDVVGNTPEEKITVGYRNHGRMRQIPVLHLTWRGGDTSILQNQASFGKRSV